MSHPTMPSEPSRPISTNFATRPEGIDTADLKEAQTLLDELS